MIFLASHLACAAPPPVGRRFTRPIRRSAYL